MEKPDLITCNWHHYPRPTCTPSFIKSRKLPILPRHFLLSWNSLYVYTYTWGTLGCLLGVLASGPKPCGGNEKNQPWEFGFQNMSQAPPLCAEPCLKDSSPLHWNFQTFPTLGMLYVSCRKITSALSFIHQWKSTFCLWNDVIPRTFNDKIQYLN